MPTLAPAATRATGRTHKEEPPHLVASVAVCCILEANSASMGAGSSSTGTMAHAHAEQAPSDAGGAAVLFVDPTVAAAVKTAARLRAMEDSDVHECRWRANDGISLEKPLAQDTLGTAIRLVDARFLIALAKANCPLVRRQDLPDKAFLDLNFIKRMEGGYFDSDLRIICVSCASRLATVRLGAHSTPN